MNKIFIIIFFIFILTNEANAYIDPGSGSIIIQAIIGGLAAAGTTITIYWNKIKRFFSKNKKNSNDNKK
tara:strand:- start:296 stop:502 length:207 start_codon:yes stop_codon:yes gene_type:complete